MKKEKIKIPFKGSLGLLALGDVGFEAWRKVKRESNEKLTFEIIQFEKGDEKK